MSSQRDKLSAFSMAERYIERFPFAAHAALKLFGDLPFGMLPVYFHGVEIGEAQESARVQRQLQSLAAQKIAPGRSDIVLPRAAASRRPRR